jgi:hypothetical protein
MEGPFRRLNANFRPQKRATSIVGDRSAGKQSLFTQEACMSTASSVGIGAVVLFHFTGQAANEPPAAAEPEVKVQIRDLRASQDEHKRYFLIGPNDLANSPADGFKLLLVLPGGDGGSDFQPFVTNIYKNALPEGYVVAQLVAPKWSEEQANQVVWPTKKSEIAAAKFTTEEFIDAVIKDVKARCKIDPRSVYTLSWSSSGPAAYAASLDEKTQISGSFVAMSVFKPDQLPDLKNAKGKAYYSCTRRRISSRCAFRKRPAINWLTTARPPNS